MSRDPQALAAQLLRIKLDGPRAAAWLMWIARRDLLRVGAHDYHFRPGEREPPYFLYAVALLRMRPRAWNVETQRTEGGGKTYRVSWRAWHTNGPRWRDRHALFLKDWARRSRNERKSGRARGLKRYMDS